MASWWVNQNATYRAEVAGGFLWSPKFNKDGRNNHFYDNMKEVAPGDLIFSFCDSRIKAVGIALGTAQTADKPNFGSAGKNWQKKGWLVPVEFTELSAIVRPKSFIRELRPYLSERYAPLQPNGNGNQGAYLVEIPKKFASILLKKIGRPDSYFRSGLAIGVDQDADKAQKAVEGRTDIGPTKKQQLVQARRGQGIFKANVRLNEKKCRLTGVTDNRLLIASHIKPWSVSSDREKLDGCNGLLLSPHIDKLFDKGFISFKNDGTILVSPKVTRTVLNQWAIKTNKKAGRFAPKQCVYLEYHRSKRFQK